MLVGIDQKISPLKFGFLIKPNSKKKLITVLELATFLWGGIHAPIIQVYKKIPRNKRIKHGITLKTIDYYKGILDNFQPDIVVYDDDLGIDNIIPIVGKIIYIPLKYFIQLIEEGHNEYGVDVLQILRVILKEEFKYKRNDELNISIPKIDKDNLFLQFFLGKLNTKYQTEINSNLSKKDFYSSPKIKSYDDISKLGIISLFELNEYKLIPQSKKHLTQGEFIYILDTNETDDLLTFWNLRALGCNIVTIPRQELEHAYFSNWLERFCERISKQLYSSKFITVLLGSNTTDETVQLFNEKCKTLAQKYKGLMFAFQKSTPRYWEETRILEADKVLCGNFFVESKYEQIESKEETLEFDLLKLPFEIVARSYKQFNYKITFNLNYFDNELKYAETIYGITPVEWMYLTASYGKMRWGISKGGIEYFTEGLTSRLHFQLPTSINFFQKYFDSRAYQVIEKPSGKLTKEVFKNLGGLMGVNLFATPKAHKLIELFEGRNTIDYQNLLTEIKKLYRNNDNVHCQNIIKRLLEYKIVEFGSNVKCPFCNQTSFYLLKDLDNNIPCNICRNRFTLELNRPTSIEWSYRGIGPFSKNNKVGGILSVFLALRLFKHEFTNPRGTLSALMEFEVKKGDISKEIDLAILLNSSDDGIRPPDLIFCECKTHKKLSTKDIDRLKQLGTDFPNAILTFCTLNEELHEDEKNLLIPLVEFFRSGFGNRPRNPLLILTSKELAPDDNFNFFSEYEDQITASSYYHDYLGYLCDLTVQKHLGLKTWGDIQTELWLKNVQTTGAD